MIPVKCAASSERENGTSQNRPKELLLVWTKSLVPSKKNCGYDSGVKMSRVSARAFWGKNLHCPITTSSQYKPNIPAMAGGLPSDAFFPTTKVAGPTSTVIQRFNHVHFRKVEFCKEKMKNEESHVNALWRRAIITHQLEKQLVPLSPGV